MKSKVRLDRVEVDRVRVCGSNRGEVDGWHEKQYHTIRADAYIVRRYNGEGNPSAMLS